MKRRLLTAWVLIPVLLVSMLSACGKTYSEKEGNDSAVELSQEETVDSKEESENIARETERQALVARFEGKKIAVPTASVFDQMVLKYIPGCEIEYINTSTDEALALMSGKVDGCVLDEPVARLIINQYPELYICGELEKSDYGFLFSDEAAAGMLTAEFNTFLKKLNASGALKEIDEVWFGSDEERKTVDRSGLTGKNGKLTFAICTDVGAPFTYMKDGEYVGYEVDIAVRFCREYGYDIDIIDMNLAGLLAGISGGRFDMAACSVNITEERKASLIFSDPDYSGSVVVVTRKQGEDEAKKAREAEFDMSDLTDPEEYKNYSGIKVGVQSGTIFDQLAEENIPDCEVQHFNFTSDMVLALEVGKIDAYIIDGPIARMLVQLHSDHHVVIRFDQEDYAFIFQKGVTESDYLRGQMNAFLQKLREDGTLKEMQDIWTGDNAYLKDVDYSDLSGENGTLTLAINTGIGAPFAYVRDGKYVGYDVDIAVRFCRVNGYGIDIVDYDFGGMLTAVSSGKADFGASCITITEEREKSMSFSEPDYSSGCVMVMKTGKTDTAEKESFFRSVKESFVKTFVKENRWKLFVSGIGVTLLITLLSILCGTALGFLIYLLYRKHLPVFTGAVNALSDLFGKTPVVVILMILYYIVFNEAALGSIGVSCIAFSGIFAFSVLALLKVGESAVDRGQMEAALALGYSDSRAYLRMIFPQSLYVIIPGYAGEIVTLIKATAVVGYIAVQDLTKVSDVIRSRTFEAFFPLIASAVIYFSVAWLLTLLVRRLQRRVDPKRRSAEKVLKGVIIR